ncbi:MAG: GNAT family N-acetyltransferase [Armatimonadota bacterium]
MPIRTAVRGDAAAIGDLLARAFPEKEWSTEHALRTFFDDPTVRATFVVEPSPGEPLLATASARIDAVNFPDDGYLHWVGTDPDARGRGLGRAVTVAAMEHLRNLERPTVVLETDDHRLPAIRLYRSLGFEPVPWHESHAERWDRVEHALANPSTIEPA